MSRRGVKGMSLFGRAAQAAGGIVARTGLIEPFVRVVAQVVAPVKSTSQLDADAPTLLALNPGRFRGELEGLADTGAFRILRLPYEWQCRLTYMFFANDIPHDHHFHPQRNPAFARRQEQLRQFLLRFLPALFRRLGVDAVLSSAVHYREDYEFGRVAQELGYPYIVLQRENIIGGSGQRRRYEERSAKLGPFTGGHVIVHNEEIRGCYLRSGFLQPDQVSALGCVRMDPLALKIDNPPPLPTRPMATLFSFNHGTGLLATQGFTHFDPRRERGFIRLFDEAHIEFARLAMQRPDVDFVIRPKWRQVWTAEIERALRTAGLDLNAIPNLRIDAETDTHALIFASTFVVGFQSTVVLEAAVAGKAVIIPMFDEANLTPYAEYVHFREELHEVADVATDAADFAGLMRSRLDNPTIDAILMAKRRAVFSQHVSNLDGSARARYVAKIGAILANRRQNDIGSGRPT